MEVREGVSLRAYNTFGIDAEARFFTEVFNLEELEEAIRADIFQRHKHLILGGGSNILLTGDYDGLVLKNNLKGIHVLREDDDQVWVQSMAGENWHQFVLFCIDKGYGGLENLSLIPGNVGASPMQNIGAYGVEVKEVVEAVEAFSLEKQQIETFSNQECRFGYRDSIFKQEAKGKYFITSVTYRLTKKPKFNTSYGAISEELEKMGVSEPSIKAISQAVINIRSSKLPDPVQIGNAGSFFKNPVVTVAQFESLKKEHQEMPFYEQSDGVKIPAGWMIEKLGWKGMRRGDAGVHEKQALVLVNYGKAGGNEIYDLSEKILQSVKTTFGITLEREVNII